MSGTFIKSLLRAHHCHSALKVLESKGVAHLEFWSRNWLHVSYAPSGIIWAFLVPACLDTVGFAAYHVRIQSLLPQGPSTAASLHPGGLSF
jgi:hypothetical protein